MSANQRAADLLNTVNKDEIDTAQMMQDHTQNTAVKDFAQTLVNDHKDAQQKLETAAGQSNINLQENKSMQNQDSKLKDRLQNENGAASDKAFVNSEIRDHRTRPERCRAERHPGHAEASRRSPKAAVAVGRQIQRQVACFQSLEQNGPVSAGPFFLEVVTILHPPPFAKYGKLG